MPRRQLTFLHVAVASTFWRRPRADQIECAAGLRPATGKDQGNAGDRPLRLGTPTSGRSASACAQPGEMEGTVGRHRRERRRSKRPQSSTGRFHQARFPACQHTNGQDKQYLRHTRRITRPTLRATAIGTSWRVSVSEQASTIASRSMDAYYKQTLIECRPFPGSVCIIDDVWHSCRAADEPIRPPGYLQTGSGVPNPIRDEMTQPVITHQALCAPPSA